MSLSSFLSGYMNLSEQKPILLGSKRKQKDKLYYEHLIYICMNLKKRS